MKNLLLTLIFLFTLNCFSQEKLIFNSKFTQSEDKWVAFEADSIGSHNFGFIYIDSQAGLTFDYAGSFKLIIMERLFLKRKKQKAL